MLSVVPGRRLAGATVAAGCRCLCNGCCQTNADHCFHFSSFFIKAKIPFGLFFFFQLAKTGTNRSFVTHTLEKRGTPAPKVAAEQMEKIARLVCRTKPPSPSPSAPGPRTWKAHPVSGCYWQLGGFPFPGKIALQFLRAGKCFHFW